jgi:hypothetical protein
MRGAPSFQGSAADGSVAPLRLQQQQRVQKQQHLHQHPQVHVLQRWGWQHPWQLSPDMWILETLTPNSAVLQFYRPQHFSSLSDTGADLINGIAVIISM